MNITAAVLYKYPNLEPDKEFSVQDDSDGKGAYLAHWKRQDIPKPSDADLNQWWSEYQTNPPTAPPSTDDRLTALENAFLSSIGL